MKKYHKISFYPVKCTYTDNPEYRKLLYQKSLRIKTGLKEIFIFEEADEKPIIVFHKKHILGCAPYKLVPSGFTDFGTNLSCQYCKSCNVHWGSSFVICPTCVIMYVVDLKGIYDKFEYALKFEDNYYREAFVKSVSAYRKNKNKGNIKSD